MKIRTLCDSVITCARAALSENLVHSSSGNFSARDPESGEIAITPSAIPYDQLEAEQIPIVNVDGELIRGRLQPTSELRMHLAIYLAREDIHGIAHTHAPFSIVFAAAGKPIRIPLTEAAQILGRDVPVAPYQKPGSVELAESVAAHLGEGVAILLERHGLVTAGRTVNDALQATRAVELNARTILMAESVGLDLEYFSAKELNDLQKDFRVNYHP